MFNLTALSVEAPLVLQSGAPLRAGVHLRWSFRSELGFPRHGFRLFRRPFGQGAWLPLATVTLPIYLRDDYPALGRPFADEIEAAIARVAQSYDHPFFQHERHRARDVVALLRSLLAGSRAGIPQHERLLPGAEARRPGLRTIEVLLAASLEPSIARILGLYWIDADVPPGIPVDYKVIGYWDDPALAATPDRSTSRWPLRAIDLTRVQLAEAATGRIALRDAEIVTARRLDPIDVTVAGAPVRVLEVSGAAPLPLLLSFRQAVREVVLTLPRAGGYDRPGWSAAGWLDDVAVPVTLTPVGDSFVLRGRDGPLHRLSLVEEGSRVTRYAVSAIAWRARTEPLVSLEAVAEYASTVWQPVRPPVITAIEPVRARADEARPGGRRTVGIRTALTGGGRDRYQCVSLRIARAHTDAPALPAESTHDMVTDGPLSATPSAELLAGWTFDGTLREQVSGATSQMRGRLTALLPRYRFVAAGTTRRTLQLAGASFVEHGFGPRRLRTLTLECWIAPDTLVDAVVAECQDALSSVRLTLVPPVGQLRFAVRGETGAAELTTSRAIAVAQWTHVVATYDGAALRIYLNGRLVGQQPAALGLLVFGASSRLTIGAEGTSGPALLFVGPRRGFRGGLVNLHVWRERIATSTRRTSGLIGAWPMDGDAVGLHAVAGAVAYDARHPEQTDRRVAVLARDTLLESDGLDIEASRRRELRLQAWIRHERGPAPATIVGFEYASGPWLGVDPTTGRLKLRLNGSEFLSRGEVPSDTWTHVLASYDGSEVVFFLNGRFDGAATAALGAVRFPEPPVARVAATVAGSHGAHAHFFRGMIADVAILSEAVGPRRPALLARRDLVAAWPLDRDFDDAMTGVPLQAVCAPVLAPGHPVSPERNVVRLDGSACLVASDHAELTMPVDALTLAARLRPAAGQPLAVVIGNGGVAVGGARATGYALGIAAVAGGYRAQLWLGGRTFDSREVFPADVWSEIVVAYDGQALRFRINGRSDAAAPAAVGRLTPDSRQPLVVGADTGSREMALVRAFRGALSDVAIWQRALTTEEMEDGRTASRYDYLDTSLPAGARSYSYSVRGADVFGRSSPWSTSHRVDVPASATLLPPQNVRAAFVPATGRITAVTLTGVELVVETDIAPDGEDVLVALVRNEAAVSHGDARDVFEITHASVSGGRLMLRLAAKALPALEPHAGHAIELRVDSRLQVTWEWSGRSRALMSTAGQFHVYLAPGPVNSLRGRVLRTYDRGDGRFTIEAGLAFDGGDGTLTGRRCMIGSHVYEIADNMRSTRPEGERAQTLDVIYRARPILKPQVDAGVQIPVDGDLAGWPDMREPASFPRRAATVPLGAGGVVAIGSADAHLVDDEDYARLRSRAPWLPPAAQTIFRVDVATRDVVPAEPDHFVPGAVVANVSSHGDTDHEQIFDVVWVETVDGGGVTVYLRAPQPGTSLPSMMRLVDARLFAGIRMETELHVPSPTATDEATRLFHIGVTATGRIEDDPDFSESRVAPVVNVIAVDRRRPRPPDDPPEIVAISPADYHGRSRVDLRWAAARDSGSGLTYQVLRASERAVFATDLQARRMRTGAYSADRIPDPRQVLERDDPDVDAWIGATFPHFRRDWPTLLAPSMSAGVSAADRHAWAEVLDAWIERFYPAADLQDLASRDGNEQAFGLAVHPPLSGLTFTDHVNGLARNRLVYRLRALGGSLTRSGLGPVSRPAAPPRTTPSPSPRLKEVKPEEGRISLGWVVSADPDVRTYLVYRGDSADEIEDLRWFGAGADPRVIATVTDPRLVIVGGSVSIGESLASAAVRGVFTYADYLRARSAARDVATMFNLLQPASVILAGEDRTEIAALRRVAGGTRVVVVVGEGDSDTPRLIGTGQTASYTDRDLTRPEHWYRVAAVAGNTAPLSAGPAARGRALVPARPRAPEIEITRHAGEAELDQIELSTPAGAPLLEARVDVRPLGEESWRPVTAWAPMRERRFARLEIPRGQNAWLRVRIRSVDRRTGIAVETLLSAAMSFEE